MARRSRPRHRALSGTAHPGVEIYSGPGSAVADEAEQQHDSFFRGGRKKRARGGGVDHRIGGGRSKPRADKHGRSPLSSAAFHEEGGEFARGGRTREQHHVNYGAHRGAGHEEPLERHHLSLDDAGHMLGDNPSGKRQKMR